METQELIMSQMGQKGSKYDTGTEGQSGKWKLMYVVENAVIAAITIENMDGSDSLIGKTLSAQTIIGGDIRSVRLNSGSIILYS